MHVRKITLAIATATLAASLAAQTPAPVVAPSPVQPVAVVPEKVICKSEIETGSLVKRHKMCFTAKQWRYVNEANEAEARKLVHDGMGGPTPAN